VPVGVNVVTCTATDSITSRSPFAQINHPGAGETRSVADGAVPFVGVSRAISRTSR
jgi:hypothetical protein